MASRLFNLSNATNLILKIKLDNCISHILTFMSSTNEGKPPIAMKVRKAATNISMEPLAWSKFIVWEEVRWSASQIKKFARPKMRHGLCSPEWSQKSGRCHCRWFPHRGRVLRKLPSVANNNPDLCTCLQMTSWWGPWIGLETRLDCPFCPELLHPGTKHLQCVGIKRRNQKSYLCDVVCKRENFKVHLTYPFAYLCHPCQYSSASGGCLIRLNQHVDGLSRWLAAAAFLDVLLKIKWNYW